MHIILFSPQVISLAPRNPSLTLVAPGSRQERGAVLPAGGGRGQRRGKPAARPHLAVTPRVGVALEKETIKVLMYMYMWWVFFNQEIFFANVLSWFHY